MILSEYESRVLLHIFEKVPNILLLFWEVMSRLNSMFQQIRPDVAF